ncbi:MaoC family dehydratase [Nocardia sp. NPDC051570]|uniref:MaoC family dehydratase n=1 Tax=Nocardia sp. NPDC051570 TaxID=3364324 RepID=UPI0037A6B867
MFEAANRHDALQGYRLLRSGAYREVVGMGFADLSKGLTVEHRPGRTVTEYDNILFCGLTGNVAPIHTDYKFAEKTRWKQALVCGSVTLGIAVGMTTRTFSGMTIANLTLTNAKFIGPVFAGDTLYATSTVNELHKTSSLPTMGIVDITTVGYVDGREVLSFDRSFMLPIDSNASRDDLGY